MTKVQSWTMTAVGAAALVAGILVATGAVTFAQSGSPTATPAPTSAAATASPTKAPSTATPAPSQGSSPGAATPTPAPGRSGHNCPNMGQGGSSSSQGSSQSSYRRAGSGSRA